MHRIRSPAPPIMSPGMPPIIGSMLGIPIMSPGMAPIRSLEHLPHVTWHAAHHRIHARHSHQVPEHLPLLQELVSPGTGSPGISIMSPGVPLGNAEPSKAHLDRPKRAPSSPSPSRRPRCIMLPSASLSTSPVGTGASPGTYI